MFTTSELRDKVLEAEAEIAAREKRSHQLSQPRRRTTKRRKVQPPLKEFEDTLEESSDNKSAISECIAVVQS
jgi:hypothetical protein